MDYNTLDDLAVKGKRVLVRADLNVPLKDGMVTDATRIERQAPTIRELAEKGAKVILLSHFDRPKGKVVPSMSLKPVVAPLSKAIGRPVAFAEDCVGPIAQAAVAALKDGEVLLLENTRFHAGEEKNDPAFTKAGGGAGRHLRQRRLFRRPPRARHHHGPGPSDAHRRRAARWSRNSPICKRRWAIRNGRSWRWWAAPKSPPRSNCCRIWSDRVEMLVIGGAMANTFLAAEGIAVGKSLYEPDHLETARKVMHMATESGAVILLPTDVVVAKEFKEDAAHRTVPVGEIAADEMVLDVGPASIQAFENRLGDHQDPGVERPLRRLRDPALRRGNRGGGQGRGGGDQGGEPFVGGGRRRHRGGSGPCRR